MNTRLNDAPILDQLDGQWQKIAGLILFKLLAKGEEVVLTLDDMKRCEREWPKGIIVFAHARPDDTLAFKIISPDEAKRITEFENQNVGHA
jgi:hypothetical protein